jgi:hypothetical protein
MKLKVIGVGVIVLGVFAGIISHSLLAFIIYLVGSISSAVIYFALGEILDNQEAIMSRIGQLEDNTNRGIFLGNTGHTRNERMKKCQSCGKEIEMDRASCPYCGGREF